MLTEARDKLPPALVSKDKRVTCTDEKTRMDTNVNASWPGTRTTPCPSRVATPSAGTTMGRPPVADELDHGEDVASEARLRGVERYPHRQRAGRAVEARGDGRDAARQCEVGEGVDTHDDLGVDRDTRDVELGDERLYEVLARVGDGEHRLVGRRRLADDRVDIRNRAGERRLQLDLVADLRPEDLESFLDSGRPGAQRPDRRARFDEPTLGADPSLTSWVLRRRSASAPTRRARVCASAVTEA